MTVGELCSQYPLSLTVLAFLSQEIVTDFLTTLVASYQDPQLDKKKSQVMPSFFSFQKMENGTNKQFTFVLGSHRECQ